LWLALNGAISILWAHALAAGSVFAGLLTKSRKDASFEGETALSQTSISSFGWSLYLFNLASWIMATSDRYLIDHFLHRADVGVYVINYAFWGIPYIVLNGWINSFARPRLYGRAADQSWDRVLRVVMATLTAGAGIAVAGTGIIYLVGKPLALWVLGERYWHSETLMLSLAAAHIFFLIGHTASTYFLAIKNSHWVWISSLLAAVINIAANIMFLPKYGLLAAAFSTVGAYSLWSVLMLSGMLYWSRRMAAEKPVST
jgi:O-antigen/teichoic acid export membrane protein